MKKACIILTTALLANAVVEGAGAVAEAGSKCDEPELQQFSAEYEVCHSRALQKLRSAAAGAASSSGR